MAQTRGIDDAPIALIGAEDEVAVYEAIGQAIRDLLPDAYVIAGSLAPDNETFRVCSVRGLGSYSRAVRKTLGVDVDACRAGGARREHPIDDRTASPAATRKPS